MMMMKVIMMVRSESPHKVVMLNGDDGNDAEGSDD